MARDKPQSTHANGTPKGMRGRGWMFTLMLMLWWFGGYGLVVYGVGTDRGPFAFLIDWQSAAFGGSSTMVGALIGGVFIFWAPPRLVRLYRRLRPDSALAADLEQQINAVPLTRTQAAALAKDRWARMDDAERVAALGRQWNRSLRIAGVVLLATFGVASWVSISANADAGQPLTQLMVPTDQPVSLGGKSDWVHVVGTTPLLEAIVSRDYSLRSTAYRDYYTPLVPPGWHAGQRIYLVEKDDTIPRYDDATDRPDPPGPLEGELSTGGPRPDIAALLRQNGYAVGDWTAVLKRQQLNGTIPSEEEDVQIGIWGLGGIIVAMFLLDAAGARHRRRKLLRQTVERGV